MPPGDELRAILQERRTETVNGLLAEGWYVENWLNYSSKMKMHLRCNLSRISPPPHNTTYQATVTLDPHAHPHPQVTLIVTAKETLVQCQPPPPEPPPNLD